MQIQLKQIEIIAALKQYITQQGIDLTSKQVTITFTAGRKESGITADLAIDEIDIPDFSESEKDPVTLTLVTTATPELSAEESPSVTESTPEEVAPVVSPFSKSASLFN